jgi:hypothetical protein
LYCQVGTSNIANSQQFKMPLKHGSQLSKRDKTRLVNQKRAVTVAIEDDEAFFGRVLKINMGRCVVNVWDHQKKRHTEVQARLPNKKKGFIKINDLVNIAPSHPDWEVQIALDSKTAASLRKEGRISAELASEPTAATAAGGKALVTTDDLGIEFDYEGVAEAEETDSVEIEDKKKTAAVEDDVDIDAI